MSAFIKAAAAGLQNEPAINGVIDDATNEIVYRLVKQKKIINLTLFSDFVDISFAAATPKGLVVPVIRNVESMSLLEVR